MSDVHTWSFQADVSGDTLIYKSERRLRQFLKYHVPDRPVTVTITDKKPTRTSQQNRLYFLYLTEIARQSGHSKRGLHELFKKMFLPLQQEEVFGEKVEYGKSTRPLNKSDFAEYLLHIEEYTNIPIPNTDEFIYGT